MIIEFIKQEPAYKAWVQDNPDNGFVLNTWLDQGKRAVQRMHKAGCSHIADFKNNLKYTSGDRIKLCSFDLNELLAKGRSRGRVITCSHCETF